MRVTAIGLLLTGCGAQKAVSDPIGWWHDLQGGTIASQRPPPPGSHDPWPNVATIPPRPAAADVAAEQRIADQLAAQRDAAETQAASNPLRPPPPAKPTPPPAPDPNGNKVVVDAAPFPPPPASPSAPPAKPTTPAAAAIPSLSSIPEPSAAVASGPLPEFAAAPPPLATGIGDFVRPPDPPPPAPAAPVPVPNGVSIAFTPGSAVLPPSAPLNLSKFAMGHKGAPLSVTGHGEAVLRNPDAQSRAMDLAFKRVQAIAASLTAAGVPASALRLHAEATGNGGSATLLN